MGDIHDDDDVCNVSSNETFREVLDRRISRRAVVGGGLAVAATTVVAGAGGGGVGTLLAARPAAATSDGRRGPVLGFTSIPTSTLDEVVVPSGYTARVLIAWGEPVSDGPAFRPDASNTAAEQAQQWGMHNDGIVYFPFPLLRNHRGLIVQNHEYTDDVLLFPDGKANWNAEKTAKSQAAHGVGVIEVVKVFGRWRVRRPSHFARRITASTPIDIAGPAAGHALLRTATDPTGRRVLGTLNNCAMGFTPWGTYLACEENFNNYFRNTGPNALESRYGVTATAPGVLVVPDRPQVRCRCRAERAEPLRVGHRDQPVAAQEHAGEAHCARPDEARRCVGRGDRRRAGGRLHGRRPGERVHLPVPLQPAVEAGPPEGEAPARRRRPLCGQVQRRRHRRLDPSHPGSPRPCRQEPGGHPDRRAGLGRRRGRHQDGPSGVDRRDRLREGGLRHADEQHRTRHDRCREPAPQQRLRAHREMGVRERLQRLRLPLGDLRPGRRSRCPRDGSTIVGDKFGSPDGLYVDPDERLWIQTDVSSSTIDTGAYAGFGNNQMLAADPTTREVRRFLVGPKGCEITGCFSTPDGRSMFVGIQHPGEAPSGDNDPANPKRFSSWPDGPAGGRPRSALLVITKDDGGIIGT